jgi:CRP-like cAMP-binding protein
MTPLHTIPLFDSLSAETRSFLESMSQERIIEPDQILFSEDEDANAFYVLVSGNLSVFHPCPGPGKCKTVGMVRPGEFV